MITILVSKPGYHKEGVIIGQPDVYDGEAYLADSNSNATGWPTTPTLRVTRNKGQGRLCVLLTNQDVELVIGQRGFDPAAFTPVPIRMDSLSKVSYTFFLEGDEADIYVREF